LERPAGSPAALLMLGHGAGGGVAAPDLMAVREAALSAGLAVARVEQPYRVAGRRAPAPAAALDEAWLAVAVRLRAGFAGLPLLVGGRSSGARVACRTASEVGAVGVIALAFPVHPPGRPDRSRLPELALPVVPVLVIQGDRDPFGMPPAAPGRTLHVVPGADHTLRTGRASIASALLGWLGGFGGRSLTAPDRGDTVTP
jgi:predicted alpha/beta-hydrolase family hydrolase